MNKMMVALLISLLLPAILATSAPAPGKKKGVCKAAKPEGKEASKGTTFMPPTVGILQA